MLWSRTEFDWELVIVAVLLAVIGANTFDFTPPVDLPYLTGVRVLLVLGVAAVLLRRWQLRDLRPVWAPLDIGVGLLVLAALVSTAAGPFQNTAAGGTRQLIEALAVFYVVVNALLRPESLKVLTAALVLTAAALALWGIAQVVLQVDDTPYVEFAGNTTLINGREVRRAVAWFPSSNVLSGYLVLALPLALAWALQPRISRPERAVAAAAAGLLLFGTVLTFARGAWIAAAVLVVGAAWLAGRRRRLAWAFPAGAALLVLIVLVPFYGRLLDLFSAGERVTIWRNTLHMIVDYRFLGVGLRNFPAVYLDYGDQRFNAHSLYLQLAADLGVLGLVAFLWVIGAWSVRLLRAARAAPDEGDRLLLLGIAGAVAGFLVQGLVEAVYAWEPFAELVWLVLGLGVAAAAWVGEPVEEWEEPGAGAARTAATGSERLAAE